MRRHAATGVDDRAVAAFQVFVAVRRGYVARVVMVPVQICLRGRPPQLKLTRLDYGRVAHRVEVGSVGGQRVTQRRNTVRPCQVSGDFVVGGRRAGGSGH